MADLKWDSINANFGDVNAAMGNSLTGISQAGTIFGELRKSILDEEQRAIDTAFRERAFQQNVDQFGITTALEKGKMSESSRHNLATEKSTIRGQDLVNKVAMANAQIQQDTFKLTQDEQNNLNLARQLSKDINTTMLGKKEEADGILKQRELEIDNNTSLSPEQKEAEKSAIKKDQNKLRETYSATAMMQKHSEEMAKAGLSNYDEKFNPFVKSAAEEQARAARNTESKMKMQESRDKAWEQSNKMIDNLNLGQEDKAALQSVINTTMVAYPNLKPDVITARAISLYPVTGEILGIGTNKFDVPLTEKDYIVNFDPTDPTNPLAISMAQAANDTSNLFNDSNIDNLAQNKQVNDTQTESLSTLTDEDLLKREKDLIKDLAKPEDVTKNSPEVKERFDILRKSLYGDSTDKITVQSEDNLKERALKEIVEERQQAINNTASTVIQERERRFADELNKTRR